MDYEIEVVERSVEDTAVIRGRVARGTVARFVPEALGELVASVGTDPIAGPPFCRMDMDGEDFLLEVGFPVERPVDGAGRVESSSLPGGFVATALNVGPYETVVPAYRAVQVWMAEHHYEPTGAPWESYLDGPEVDNPRTLVCWPCRRRPSWESSG